MSTTVLRLSNSFCEEVPTRTLAITSTPISKNFVSTQETPDINKENCSPILKDRRNTENVTKKALNIKSKLADKFNSELKQKSKINKTTHGSSSNSVNKRKQFSPKTSSNNKVSKKSKNISSSPFENKVVEILERSSLQENPLTRNKYKKIIDNSVAINLPVEMDSSKSAIPKKTLVSNFKEKNTAKKSFFKTNVKENISSTKTKSVVSNASYELRNINENRKSENGSSHTSLKSFSRRKLYSNALDFSDNENNAGDASFLEEKKVINIYDASKKTDSKVDRLKEISCNNNTDTYSLRTSKNSKNYFGNEIPEKSVIYKTATKNETNKHVIDFVKSCVNRNSNNLEPENSIIVLEESESENMFILQEDNFDDGNKKGTNKLKTKSHKNEKNKPKKPERLKKIMNSSKKTQNTTKGPKKIVKPKLQNKNNSKKEKITYTVVKRNNVKQKISNYLKKNTQSKFDNINHEFINRKYKNKREKSDVLDNKISDYDTRKNKQYQSLRDKRNTNSLTKTLEKYGHNSSSFVEKCAFKYSPMITKKAYMQNTLNHESHNTLNHQNSYFHLFRNRKNEPRFNLQDDFEEIYRTQSHDRKYHHNRDENAICLYKPEVFRAPSKSNINRNFDLPDDFELIYNRYFPSNIPSKKSKELASLPAHSSLQSNSYLSTKHSNFSIRQDDNHRENTVYLTNKLCEESILKKQQSYNIELYIEKNVINHSDAFKLPVGIPRKQNTKIVRNKKCIEYELPSIRDDISVNSEFSTVSRNNYFEKEREPEFSQNAFSQDNKSICTFIKKSSLIKSNSVVSQLNKYSSTKNHTSHKKQNSNVSECSSSINNNYGISMLKHRNIQHYNDVQSENMGGKKELEPMNLNSQFVDKFEIYKKYDNLEPPSLVNKVQSSETKLNSPMLQKFNQFKERLNQVSDVDSWHNNFSVIPEPSTSSMCAENLPVTLYKKNFKTKSVVSGKNDENKSKPKNNLPVDQKSDDSWITIERPNMPRSPWRYSDLTNSV